LVEFAEDSSERQGRLDFKVPPTAVGGIGKGFQRQTEP